MNTESASFSISRKSHMEAISPNRRWNISAESAEDGTYKRYSRYNQNSELSLCLIPCPNGRPNSMPKASSVPAARLQMQARQATFRACSI